MQILGNTVVLHLDVENILSTRIGDAPELSASWHLDAGWDFLWVSYGNVVQREIFRRNVAARGWPVYYLLVPNDQDPLRHPHQGRQEILNSLHDDHSRGPAQQG